MLISINVPNKQTGNSFLKKTIKHIDPNKTYRLGEKDIQAGGKSQKRINAQGLLFGTLEYREVDTVLKQNLESWICSRITNLEILQRV